MPLKQKFWNNFYEKYRDLDSRGQNIISEVENWDSLCEKLEGVYVDHVIFEILSVKILKKIEV